MIVYTLPLLLVGVVNAYPQYQGNIPNGRVVPDPCNAGSIWSGVGHVSSGGGGVRNPFGVAFGLNSRTWNPTLCQADSDGDGFSNGQELGDPNCVWTTGAVPARNTSLTHPGVCEPVTSALCQGLNSKQNIITGLCASSQSTVRGSSTTTTTRTSTLSSASTSLNQGSLTRILLGHRLAALELTLVIYMNI